MGVGHGHAVRNLERRGELGQHVVRVAGCGNQLIAEATGGGGGAGAGSVKEMVVSGLPQGSRGGGGQTVVQCQGPDMSAGGFSGDLVGECCGFDCCFVDFRRKADAVKLVGVWSAEVLVLWDNWRKRGAPPSPTRYTN